MEAGELYAFVFAKEFCELRSYGVSSADALQKAQEKAQSNSLIASSMYRDQAIILPDGNSLAARRKLNATIEMCSQLMDPL